MKTLSTLHAVVYIAITAFALTQFSCKKSDAEEPSTNNPGVGNNNPDFISSQLILNNAIPMNGQIPDGTTLADLKIDKDTIFLNGEISNRISILYPVNGAYAGSSRIFLQVIGAKNYYDITPLEKETLDTIGVIYIDINTDTIKLPLTFEIEIAPHDNAGKIIDRFKRKVTIEEPGKPCEIIGPNGSSTWKWQWTKMNGDLFLSPTYRQVTTGSANGCCLDGKTVDCIANGIPESEWRTIDGIDSYIWQLAETFALNNDKTMVGVLLILNQSLHYQSSNFCTLNAGYSTTEQDNFYWGKWDYNSASRLLTFTEIQSRLRSVYVPESDIYIDQYDQVFLGQHNNYEVISCHFILETTSTEGGGTGGRTRLFERENNPGWKD